MAEAIWCDECEGMQRGPEQDHQRIHRTVWDGPSKPLYFEWLQEVPEGPIREALTPPFSITEGDSS